MIFGNLYNGQLDLATVTSVMSVKPGNSVMCLGGIGKDQLKSNILGLLYADGVRIGLEDNLYYRDKEKATNIQLLQRIHRIMEELDYQLLTAEEFKKMGYANRKTHPIG